MRLGWIPGWAVPLGAFGDLVRTLAPGAEHILVSPTARAVEDLLEQGPFDRLIGYSLGSLLLLRSQGGFGCGADLLAPIFAFPLEEGLGGRKRRASVRSLARRLRGDPGAALDRFRIQAGLSGLDGDPGSVADLEWGLMELEKGRVEPPLPPGWRAWVGSEDPFLDAALLAARSPAIRTVKGAGHGPEPLVREWANAPLPC